MFIDDYEKFANNWSSDVKSLLTMLGLNSHFTDFTKINLTDEMEKDNVLNRHTIYWYIDCSRMSLKEKIICLLISENTRDGDVCSHI